MLTSSARPNYCEKRNIGLGVSIDGVRELSGCVWLRNRLFSRHNQAFFYVLEIRPSGEVGSWGIDCVR